MKETLLVIAVNLIIHEKLRITTCYRDFFLSSPTKGYFYQTRNEQNAISAAKTFSILVHVIHSTFGYECTITTK